jgi:hypothetical protein
VFKPLVTGHVLQGPVSEPGPVHVRPTVGKMTLRYLFSLKKYFSLSLSVSLHQTHFHFKNCSEEKDLATQAISILQIRSVNIVKCFHCFFTSVFKV